MHTTSILVLQLHFYIIISKEIQRNRKNISNKKLNTLKSSSSNFLLCCSILISFDANNISCIPAFIMYTSNA